MTFSKLRLRETYTRTLADQETYRRALEEAYVAGQESILKLLSPVIRAHTRATMRDELRRATKLAQTIGLE